MAISYIQQTNPIRSQLWLPFKEQHTELGEKVTTSYGGQSSIRYMQVGDGSTSSTYPALIGDKGFRFTSDQYVTFLTNDSLTLGDNWSVGMLIRPKLPTGGQTDKYLCGFSNGGGIILNDSSSSDELTYNDGTTTVSSGVNLENDRYYFICVTKDESNNVNIYVNGDLEGSDAGTNSSFDLDYIGCDNTLNNFYNGEIRELFSFDVELNEIHVDVINSYLYRKVANQELYFDPSSIPDLAAWFDAVDSDATLTKATQPTLNDHDMEDAGVVAWTVQDGVLTKQASDPPEGTQWLQVKNETAGTVTIWANQNPLIINGNRYSPKGWAKGYSSISTTPTIYNNGGVGSLWAGVANDTWQQISAEFTATSSEIFWGALNSQPNALVGFDDLSMPNLSRTEWYPRAGSLGVKLEQATAIKQPWWTGEGVKFGALGAEERHMTFDTPITQTTNQTIYFAVDKLIADNAFRALIQRTNVASPQPYLSSQTGTPEESAIFVDGASRCIIPTPVGKYIIRYRHTASLVGLQKGNSTEVTYVTTPTLSTWDALSGSAGGQGMDGTVLEVIIVNKAVSETNDLVIKNYLSNKHNISL